MQLFVGTDSGQETDTPVTMEDVRTEMGLIRTKYNMGRIRMKPVRRKHPFDTEGVPRGDSDFLKVICSSSINLPADLTGTANSHDGSFEIEAHCRCVPKVKALAMFSAQPLRQQRASLSNGA